MTGVTHVSGVTQITVHAQDGHSDVQLQVFQAMASHHISVDFINVNPGGAVYTVFDHDAEQAVSVLHEIGYSSESGERLRESFRHRRRNERRSRNYGAYCGSTDGRRDSDSAIRGFQYDDLGARRRTLHGQSAASASC